jgi:hypothetical protein
MLKSIIAACLSRRAIVVFALLACAGAWFVAFKRLNQNIASRMTPA